MEGSMDTPLEERSFWILYSPYKHDSDAFSSRPEFHRGKKRNHRRGMLADFSGYWFFYQTHRRTLSKGPGRGRIPEANSSNLFSGCRKNIVFPWWTHHLSGGRRILGDAARDITCRSGLENGPISSSDSLAAAKGLAEPRGGCPWPPADAQTPDPFLHFPGNDRIWRGSGPADRVHPSPGSMGIAGSSTWHLLSLLFVVFRPQNHRACTPSFPAGELRGDHTFRKFA